MADLMSSPCVLWNGTLTVKGYPQEKVRGRTIRVHRRVCEEAHGPAPSPRHHAAHRCGVRRCVNGEHLYWATPAENNADRKTHGTMPVGERVGTSKLTADDVRAMRRSGLTQMELAEIYGVSQSAISAAITGHTWAHVR